jgi:hypothetical protein
VLFISGRFRHAVPHLAGAVSTYADFRGHRMGIDGRSKGHRVGIVSPAKTIVSIDVLRLASFCHVDHTAMVTCVSLNGGCVSSCFPVIQAGIASATLWAPRSAFLIRNATS